MKLKLFIETYGCQMNSADSEVIAAVMEMAGYELSNDLEDADAVLLNTCSIRDNAEQKIVSRLQYLQSVKRRKNGRLIIGVVGCMAERAKEELTERHGVDLVALKENDTPKKKDKICRQTTTAFQRNSVLQGFDGYAPCSTV